MSWLVIGGSLLCLAPAVGAFIVAGLLAFHELRSRASRVSSAKVGRRASTNLLQEFLAEETDVEAGKRRRRAHVPVRRKEPVLLYELLDERRPRLIPMPRPHPAAVGRAPRPTRLVPMTA